jgi:adenylate cyclase
MAREIERKFLVTGDFKQASDPSLKLSITQGYLCIDPSRSVRVRLAEWKNWFRTAQITIKGPSSGSSRDEYEIDIANVDDAVDMLDNLCLYKIKKHRHIIKYKNCEWEVDEFLEDNQGLIVAEIELNNETDSIDIPDWVGTEVTGDARYYNLALAQHPYKNWDQQTKR